MSELIYQPKGKAREYSPWACNLFLGCSNKCEYCYNRKGIWANLLGKDEPTYKNGASLSNFKKELEYKKELILQDGKGLFFNFVSDPFLNETYELNMVCAEYAMDNGVPCVFLSKRRVPTPMLEMFKNHADKVKVGFTLTGCDELEQGAVRNDERIEEIKMLNLLGLKTWASIEPIIDISRSEKMLEEAYDAGCRHFKIGLLSGNRKYTESDVIDFCNRVKASRIGRDCDIYWKDSITTILSANGIFLKQTK